MTSLTRASDVIEMSPTGSISSNNCESDRHIPGSCNALEEGIDKGMPTNRMIVRHLQAMKRSLEGDFRDLLPRET